MPKKTENKAITDQINEVIDGIGDPLFILDKNQVITKVNKATCTILNKKPEDLLGKHCYEVVHGTKCPITGCPATTALETKQVVSGEIEEPNLDLPLLMTVSPILNKKGEVTQLVHTAKDISKLKNATTELQIAASLFESVSDSILAHDKEGNIYFFNSASYTNRGYTKDEFQALNIHDLETPGNPNFFEEKMDLIFQHPEGITFEVSNLGKDKTHIPIEIHAKVIEVDGKQVVLSVGRDISERKKNQQMLQENNQRIEAMNEKLRVVGSLTRHDVRNKLSTITGYSYILKKKHPEITDVVNAMNLMEQAVAQSVKIFDFAKMYEQLGVEDLTYMDVEGKFKEACALFSGTLPKIDNQTQGLTILADSFLRQMLYNFIDNTLKYGKTTTTIKLHYQTNQDSLNLIYEDDGQGIPTENKQHLFKEGFTTGGSTGYGLFLTKKMMDVYGWKIEEKGQPNKGVKFIINIPKTHKNGKQNYRLSNELDCIYCPQDAIIYLNRL